MVDAHLEQVQFLLEGLHKGLLVLLDPPVGLHFLLAGNQLVVLLLLGVDFLPHVRYYGCQLRRRDAYFGLALQDSTLFGLKHIISSRRFFGCGRHHKLISKELELEGGEMGVNPG